MKKGIQNYHQSVLYTGGPRYLIIIGSEKYLIKRIQNEDKNVSKHLINSAQNDKVESVRVGQETKRYKCEGMRCWLVSALRELGEWALYVSWTEESARSGTREVRLYTEEGYTALRKALRSGETADSVQSLTSIALSHSTGYTGPGINSEVMAAILSVLVAYAAITNKNKLLA